MSWLLRRNSAFYDVVCSIADQALLAGGSVIVTAGTAYWLKPSEFGTFTIAWSLSILCEGVLLKSLLDDPLPSVAARVARSQIAALRSCFLSWSALGAGIIAAIAVIAGLFCQMAGLLEHPMLVAATGGTILATRLQNVVRRMLYLDRRIRMALASDVVYFVVQLAALGSLVVLGSLSATTAMVCGSLSSAAAFLLGTLRWRSLRRPTAALLLWSLKRSVDAGRWIFLSNLAFWTGSTGVIPIAGLVIGSTAGGTLRILFLLFAPLSQVNTALLTMLLPRAAMRLRNVAGASVKGVARESIKLFGGLSVAYGLCVAFGAGYVPGFDRVSSSYDITIGKVAWMALAIACEGGWTGLALPLFATGQTKRFLLSRLVAVPMLLGPIPLAGWLWGGSGTVAAIAVSSATSLTILAIELSRERATDDSETRVPQRSAGIA